MNQQLRIALYGLAGGFIAMGIAGLATYPIPAPWALPAFGVLTVLLALAIGALIPIRDDGGQDADDG
jgi:hypothetical protein